MKWMASLTVACVGLLLAIGVPSAAWAHSFSYSTVLGCTGFDCAVSLDHEDSNPFKGWANITIQNTGTEVWGDFHFEIFEVSGFGSVENVDFIVASPYEPTSTQSGLTWVVNNTVVGATLDLFFYSDPVNPGETATFSVYTDNSTDKLGFFGTMFYATPVPEPGTFLLLGLGLIGISRLNKR